MFTGRYQCSINRDAIMVTLLIAELTCAAPRACAGIISIGFDGFSTSGQFTGSQVEDGFNYSPFGSGGLFADVSIGNPAPEMEALAALGGGILRIVSVTPGQPFLFRGMDIAERDFQRLLRTITVEGFLNGMSVASEIFDPLLPPVGSAFGSYLTVFPVAGLQFATVDELRVSLPGESSNQVFFLTRVDNIRLEAIPEPSTFVLMGVGVAVLGFTRRRSL